MGSTVVLRLCPLNSDSLEDVDEVSFDELEEVDVFDEFAELKFSLLDDDDEDEEEDDEEEDDDEDEEEDDEDEEEEDEMTASSSISRLGYGL